MSTFFDNFERAMKAAAVEGDATAKKQQNAQKFAIGERVASAWDRIEGVVEKVEWSVTFRQPTYLVVTNDGKKTWIAQNSLKIVSNVKYNYPVVGYRKDDYGNIADEDRERFADTLKEAKKWAKKMTGPEIASELRNNNVFVKDKASAKELKVRYEIFLMDKWWPTP